MIEKKNRKKRGIQVKGGGGKRKDGGKNEVMRMRMMMRRRRLTEKWGETADGEVGCRNESKRKMGKKGSEKRRRKDE